MKAVGLKATVAAPVLRRGEAWGALVASAAEEESLPPGCEQRLVGLAELLAQALANADARAELAASQDAPGRIQRRDPAAARAARCTRARTSTSSRSR